MEEEPRGGGGNMSLGCFENLGGGGRGGERGLA
jgi:hypothetical protein